MYSFTKYKYSNQELHRWFDILSKASYNKWRMIQCNSKQHQWNNSDRCSHNVQNAWDLRECDDIRASIYK